jgi:predicted nucleotidyltransferase component of viral defense system
MSGKAMSFKARIRNIAKEKGLPAQVILQNYMFERFLERLSKSEYKDKFIIKGGMLIAALVGLDNRATMDLDTTVKNYKLNSESITKAINDICHVELEDEVDFTMSGLNQIRDDDVYGGYRVSINADYENINIPMHIDVTTGDIITPKEIMYQFKMNFAEGVINILSYNIETVLAEKVETILRRGELNTRPRDFYDVYVLTKTQRFDQSIFAEALRGTAEHRKSMHIFNNILKRVKEIQASETLKSRWERYTIDYNYAKGISYDGVIVEIKLLIGNL